MPNHKQIIVQRPLVQVSCKLGEGPIYDTETSTLHFVDIEDKKVYHLNINSLEFEVEQYKDAVTCLALQEEAAGLACVAAKGFGILNKNSRTISYLAQPLPEEHIPYTRFNDGGCDSKGRFFAGTVYCEARGIPGKLFRYDPEDGSCKVVDEGPFTDSNGLGWSPDEKTFYFTDSIRNVIHAYDYDDGALSKRRVFVDGKTLGPGTGLADGLTVDSQGYVWSARWGGSRIIRFNPSGEIDLEVMFPTALNVTACTFGGPSNDQLYVTTTHCSANGEDGGRQVKYPDSGALFVVDITKVGGHRITGLKRNKLGSTRTV